MLKLVKNFKHPNFFYKILKLLDLEVRNVWRNYQASAGVTETKVRLFLPLRNSTTPSVSAKIV
jgi:hypothetical protein